MNVELKKGSSNFDDKNYWTYTTCDATNAK